MPLAKYREALVFSSRGAIPFRGGSRRFRMNHSSTPLGAPDPNQCPCTTGNESFDGMTLGELGAQWSRLKASDEDGHLEVDDWYRRNSEGAP